MQWIGLLLALVGGLTVVFTFSKSITGVAIGVVLFVIGLFAMRSGSGGGGKG
jgi:hypothetical protein